MRFMFIDSGVNTGWAHGDPEKDEPPISGAHRLPSVQITKRLIVLESFIIDTIKANGITDVFIEKPIIPKVSSFDAITTLIGYALIEGIAAQRCGCNTSLVDMQSWRSELGLPTQGPKNVLQDPAYAEFVGKKNGLKEAKRKWVKNAAIKYAVKQGCNIESEDEADAACGYFCVRQRFLVKQDKPKFDLFGNLGI